MWFTLVSLKSISKRLAQADNTQKRAENGNPIEELCIILAAVLELAIHMFRPGKNRWYYDSLRDICEDFLSNLFVWFPSRKMRANTGQILYLPIM